VSDGGHLSRAVIISAIRNAPRVIHASARTRSHTYTANLRPVTRFRSMNVDWIAGHHLPGNTRRAGERPRGMCAYTVTIIRMAITLVAAVVAIRARYGHTRPPRARKSTRIPGNRLRCAAPAGIEFIIPLGTTPLPDHFRVFAFHGADRRHVPSIEPSSSCIPFLHPASGIRFVLLSTRNSKIRTSSRGKRYRNSRRSG